MRLKNKKTGEIVNANELDMFTDVLYLKMSRSGSYATEEYPSIKAFTEEWEDYEEPKEYWHIFGTNITKTQEGLDELYDKRNKEIGNYFETKEETEEAVGRLKAAKRLRDKGFRFEGWTIDDGLRVSVCTNFDSDGIYDEDRKEVKKDLDACFGGEE